MSTASLNEEDLNEKLKDEILFSDYDLKVFKELVLHGANNLRHYTWFIYFPIVSFIFNFFFQVMCHLSKRYQQKMNKW